MSIEVFDSRFAAVAQGVGELQRVCIGAVWSDIPNNRMLRWDGGPKNLFDPDNGYRNQYQAIWGTKQG